MSEEKMVFKIKTAAKIKDFLRITTENDSIITCFEIKDVDLFSKLEPGTRIRLKVWQKGQYTNGKDIEILGSQESAAPNKSNFQTAESKLNQNQSGQYNLEEDIQRFKKFMIGLSQLIDNCFTK